MLQLLAIAELKTIRNSGHTITMKQPAQYNQGKRDVIGGITIAGEVNLRRALCQATHWTLTTQL